MGNNIEHYAWRICNIFENLLDKYDITIPSDNREGEEDEARLYGAEYYETEALITEVLIDLVNSIKTTNYTN